MKSKADYLVLALFSTGYLALVYRYQATPRYILLSTGAFAVVYLIWGMIHHVRAGNFHFRIVLEYLLVAILGIAIVSTLLL